MKQFTTLQLELLHCLCDGACHSGNALGKKLQVSRTTIWKHINSLIEKGLPIFRLAKQGYQLAYPLILVNEFRLKHFLAAKNFSKPFQLHLFISIDSTNRFLKELSTKEYGSSQKQNDTSNSGPLAPQALVAICCAEMQTQGRGRFGREWVSPFGENIYFSSRWQLNCCVSQLAGLSLVVGLALLSSLKAHNIQDLSLKWPNDLYWQDKKLAGVLIEIIAETNGYVQLIIGIGLNVNMSTQHPSLTKPWCSLLEITHQRNDRNKLLADLIVELDHYLAIFLKHGFGIFIKEWEKNDYLYGKFIEVSQPGGHLKGQACGVNESAQLCLKNDEGYTHYLSSGDTSLQLS